MSDEKGPLADQPQQNQPEPQIDIILPAEMMGGVWANFARVSHSQYEFTLDFVRIDFGQRKGIVVSRISVSPLFITQLIDALNQNWANYARKAMPQEVQDDGHTDD